MTGECEALMTTHCKGSSLGSPCGKPGEHYGAIGRTLCWVHRWACINPDRIEPLRYVGEEHLLEAYPPIHGRPR